MTRRLAFAIALATLFGVAGCGGTDGPDRYRVSGTVTLDGVPIPYGEVILTPDSSKKNSGAQGKAPIKDGKFDTRFDGGLGSSGGPIIARVNGMSAPGGKTLCEFEIPLDLPKSDSTQELKVPKSGKSKGGKGNASDI